MTCFAMQRNATHCIIMHGNAMQCRATQCRSFQVPQRNAMQRHAMQRITMHCNANHAKPAQSNALCSSYVCVPHVDPSCLSCSSCFILRFLFDVVALLNLLILCHLAYFRMISPILFAFYDAVLYCVCCLILRGIVHFVILCHLV